MMHTQSLNGRETRQLLLEGLAQTGRAIRLAYGPSGCGVMIHGAPAAPEVLRDGHSIAREVIANHKVSAQSGLLLKEVLFDMNRDIGDGCSSLALIAEAVFRESLLVSGHGVSIERLSKQLEEAAGIALEELDKKAVSYEPDTDRHCVAKGASKSQFSLAEQIAHVDAQLGGSGHIVVKGESRRGIHVEISKGMSLPAGHAFELFSCQRGGLSDDFIAPFVLLADIRISEFGKLVPILEGFAKKDKSIVIFCRNIEGSALAALALNIRDAGLKATAIAIPDVSFRALDILGDIQVVSGGAIVSDTLGQSLDSLRPDMLGRLSRVEVFANRCVFWGAAPDGDLLNARLAEIRQEIAKNKYLSLDRERAELRLARLTGSIAEMHIGKFGLNGQEQSIRVAERIARALLNARTYGVLPGAGVSYLHAAERCSTIGTMGGEVLSRALRAPRLAIDGFEDGQFFRALRRDYHSRQIPTNGCLDSAITVKEAISRAVSFVIALLRTEASITQNQSRNGNFR
ncbi:MAG: hypothetical protein OXC66_07125 [Roseovarius sp.]|nr:hypothetical protein [Roseovarius sp.]